MKQNGKPAFSPRQRCQPIKVGKDIIGASAIFPPLSSFSNFSSMTFTTCFGIFSIISFFSTLSLNLSAENKRLYNLHSLNRNMPALRF